MTKQEIIVGVMRQEVKRALEAYREYSCRHASSKAAHEVWQKFNEDDGIGGFSGNPHNIEVWKEAEQNHKIAYENLKEAYDFAVDTFLGEAK